MSGLSLILKYVPMAVKLGHGITHPEIGVLPKVRADAVDAINDLRAKKGRTPLTSESLFLFFAAFIRTRENLEVEWTRPTDDIIALLMRGLENNQSAHVASLLTLAMDQVPEMIRLVPSLAIKARDVAAPALSDAAMAKVVAQTLVTFVVPFGSLFSMGAHAVKSSREKNFELAVLRSIAESLGQCGLSTMECRSVLIEQGLAEEKVLKALQL